MKKKLLKIVLLLLIISCNNIKKTSIIDNDIQKVCSYLKKSRKHGLNKKFDSAFYFIEKSKELTKDSKNEELKFKIILSESKLNYWKGNLPAAEELIEDVVKTSELSDSLFVLSRAQYAEYCLYKKDFTKALFFNIEAEKKIVAKREYNRKDTINLFNIYSRLGIIYKEKENYNKSKKYFEESLKFTPNSNMRSYILFELGNVFNKNGRETTAKKYMFDGLNIALKNKWQLMLPTYYSNISTFYNKLKKPDSAIFYARKGLENNTYCRLDWLNKNLGNAYYLKKEYNNALTHFNKAMTLPASTLEDKVFVSNKISKTYYKLGKNKKALLANFNYIKLKDSLNKLKVKENLHEISEKYESEKKELNIKLLKKENAYKEEIINKQRTKLFIFLLIFLFLVIFGSITFYNYKQKIEVNNILYKKNREIIAIKDIINPVNLELKINDDLKEKISGDLLGLINEQIFLDKEMTLAVLAKKLDTNTSYLSKLINEKYRVNFSTFINNLRIDFLLKNLEEKRELRHYTVEHLADISGFSSSNAFYRSFKKNTGLTPSYYIKKRLEQEKM